MIIRIYDIDEGEAATIRFYQVPAGTEPEKITTALEGMDMGFEVIEFQSVGSMDALRSHLHDGAETIKEALSKPVVRVRDLKNQTTVPGPHPVLYCPLCGVTCSANRGDYGDYNGFKDDHVFKCKECDELLELGRFITNFVPETP